MELPESTLLTYARIANVFEEMLAKFNKDIDDKNLMHVLVKAHLYIEHELDLLLKKNVNHPEHLPELKFAQKEKWALALGIVPISEKNVLHHLNLIRNKLAHNLDYEFTKEILDSHIISQMSKERKNKYDESLNYYTNLYGEGLNGELRCALSVVWGFLLELRIIPNDIRDQLK